MNRKISLLVNHTCVLWVAINQRWIYIYILCWIVHVLAIIMNSRTLNTQECIWIANYFVFLIRIFGSHLPSSGIKYLIVHKSHLIRHANIIFLNFSTLISVSKNGSCIIAVEAIATYYEHANSLCFIFMCASYWCLKIKS